jgi:hypothetical protein
MLFREFAAECMELAQTASSPEKHVMYMKMASVWFQMAQRECLHYETEHGH